MADHTLRWVFVGILKIAIKLTIASFIIAFSFTACDSSKRTVNSFPTFVDPQEKAIEFIESLKSKKVHSIIGYHLGCTDCQAYSDSPYYVFWNSENIWFTTKFTRKNRYKPLSGYVPPIDYLENFLDSLQNENLVLPNFIRSAYTYDEVSIILNEATFNYRIKSYEREYNTNAYRVILVDSIKSTLANISDEAWQALDY